MTDPLLQAMQQKWGKQILNENKSQDDNKEEYHYELKPQTLTDKKIVEDIRKLQINNEKELNNLVERKMAQAMIEEVGHSIQTNFVDFARRESPVIAALLEIPHLERDLEKILSNKIKVSIESVKGTCVKMADDGVFE